MLTEVILLQLGETMNEGTIATWHKRVGDPVERGEPLCAVETDKAVLEIEAPRSGYLAQIDAPAGSTVPVLQIIARIADRADELAAPPAAAVSTGDGSAAAAPAPPAAVAAADAPAEPGPPLRVSPAARRIAREHGLALAGLRGSGPAGRVVEADVWRELRAREAAAQPPAAPVPAAPAPAGDWELVPLGRLRRLTAERLSQSYREAVHVTLHCEVDVSEAAKLRSQLSQEWEPQHGLKVTYTDLVVKAAAKALAEHRGLNASYTPEGVRLHRRVHVGVAVAVAAGLIVPVVRDADRLPLLEVCRAVRGLTERARAGKTLPDELGGGTFTVTNMGTLGVDTFTPIINWGEGAILGVGRVAERPVVRQGSVVARATVPLSLSFDHRLADGAGAAAFLARVQQVLESPYLILV